MMAPRSVPVELLASTTAIITATYNQAIGTMYILKKVKGGNAKVSVSKV
jgi:hypothetical protein